ncbi:8729_t:CDS:2, partial [Funneliformis caledonium]
NVGDYKINEAYPTKKKEVIHKYNALLDVLKSKVEIAFKRGQSVGNWSVIGEVIYRIS